MIPARYAYNKGYTRDAVWDVGVSDDNGTTEIGETEPRETTPRA